MSPWKQRLKQQVVDGLQPFAPSVADDLLHRRQHDRWTKTTSSSGALAVLKPKARLES